MVLLSELLLRLQTLLLCRGHDIEAICSTLHAILEFLLEQGPSGHENCVAVSRFVLVDLVEDPQAYAALSALPDELKLILEDMGAFLDDTHKHPDIAARFQSAPRQLLGRLQKLRRESGGLDGESER